MALDTNALVALADTKVYLNIDKDDQDPLLELLINQVSGLVRGKLGREFIAATYTAQKLDGNGSAFLYLPAWPVTGTITVVEDGETLVEGTDFVLYAAQGILRRLDGVWPEGAQNIVVTYPAGYALAAVPRDIQHLVMNKVGKEWQKQKNSWWGQSSRGAGDGSISFETEIGLTEDEIAALRPHRRIVL